MGLESFNAGGLESFVDSGLQARGGGLPSILIWQPVEDKSPNDDEFVPYWHLAAFYTDRNLANVTHVMAMADWGSDEDELSSRSISQFDLIVVGLVRRDPPWWSKAFDGSWFGRLLLMTDWAVGHQLGGVDLGTRWEPSRTWISSKEDITGVRLANDLFDDVRTFNPQLELSPVATREPLMADQDTLKHDATSSLIITDTQARVLAFSFETFPFGPTNQFRRLSDGLYHKFYATSRRTAGVIDVVVVQDNNIINATTVSTNEEVVNHNAAFFENLVKVSV